MSRLPAADTAWLVMDHAANPMVVTAVLLLARSVPAERLMALMEARILSAFPPFRWRIGPDGYEEVAVDAAAHVDTLFADDDGEPGRVLEDLVTAWASAPLDPDRPRWQLATVHGPKPAVLARVHHALGDGFALARVLLTLTDGAEAPPPQPHAPHAAWSDVLAAPAALAKLLFTPDDRSPLHPALTGKKRFAWTRTWLLADVADRAHAAGATVNDALLASLGGALARLLGASGSVRAFVPVNLRPLDAPIPPTLGNRFGIVLVDLPLGGDDDARLAAVHAEMDRIKASPEAMVAFGLIEALGVLPAEVERALVESLFAPKAALVLTNVPGPKTPITLDGVPVTDVGFWVPQTGDVGLGVSLLSYAGRLSVGVSADEAVIDARALVEAFEDELSRWLGQEDAVR